MSEVEISNNSTQTQEAVEPASIHPYMDKYTAPIKPMTRQLVGRKDELARLEACLNRPELCNAMLLAEAGTGKCLANDTLIPVADERGYVPIAYLKVGDIVFDENGNPTKVLGVYPQGKKSAYRITFADGSSLVCNDEHLWNVRTRAIHYKDGEYQTLTLREMMDYGITRDVKCGEMKSFYIPLNGAVDRPEVELPIHPYVLGVLIGDGCLSGEDALSISSPNDKIPNKVAELIGAAGVEANPHNYSWFFLASEGKNKFVQQYELANLCDFDYVFNTKSIHRRIPKMYKLASRQQRFELLQGLMDTDGSMDSTDRHHCTYSTNSEQLAYDVLELVRSLGIRASLNKNYREDKENIEYSVYIILPDDEKVKLFTEASGKGDIDITDNRKFHKIYNDMAVASVEDLHYETEMTCIYVEAESHLFQAGKEHIVTHNTALVQGMMTKDTKRTYMEVNLSKMIADYDAATLGNILIELFNEVRVIKEKLNQEVVLFIDEFHQIVQLSPAAVEALKPLLADSGTRGIKVIAATTYEEFRKFIAPNQPLVERLQRINIPQPDKAMTIGILKGMAKRYGVDTQFYNDSIYEAIYENTNRYVPSSAQPRKSIRVLDAMVGWHRATGRPLDKKLLGDVIYESEGVNIAFRVDASSIKKNLDAHVFAQELATTLISDRLQIAVADLNDKSKPMASFLFTGSTGVGKTEMTKQLASILFGNGRDGSGDENQTNNKNLIRFDMTEYANKESMERFRSEITARIWERPYSVLLLDEIEKACAEVTRLLLQILDDGRLSDENGKQVAFTNCYVILTTNAGSEIYKTISQYNSSDTGDGSAMKRYNKLIRNSISQTQGDNKFPPELLGRIDAIIPFQPLSEGTQKKIIQNKILKLMREVSSKHGIELRVDKKVVDYLVKDNMDTDSNSGGARIVTTKLTEEVTTPVARFINENPDVKIVGVEVMGDMAWEHKDMLESSAYIKVAAHT